MNDRELLKQALALSERGRRFAMVTVVRAVAPTSAKAGAKALIEEDGTMHGWIGGGCAKSVVIGVAQQAIHEDASRLVRISPEQDTAAVEEGVDRYQMTCASNGTLELFIEPSAIAPTVLIVGSTPVARELAPVVKRLGFRVETAAVSAPGPENSPASIGVYVAQAFADLRPTFCVVATQGERDEDALAAALQSGAEKVLVVVGRRKFERLKEQVCAMGVTQQAIDSLAKAPAGHDIGAVTPEEIAVSIAAELVSLRRRGAMPTRSIVHGEPEEAAASANAKPVQEKSAESFATDPVCGMRVPTTSEHRSDYLGRAFFFCCDGCKKLFDQSPGRFARAMAVQEPIR